MYTNTHALVEEKMEIDWSTGEMRGLDEAQEVDQDMAGYYQMAKSVGAPLPKVRDVVLSLDQLVVFRDSGSMLEQIDLLESIGKNDIRKKAERADRRTRERHSLKYILMSSLAFEAVILGLACMIFVRKDY